ncbi:unnamed protein product [Arabidopsis thaliana]|uniref:Uncharacterized protein At1g17740 n=2 Tax=Arabidopsis thaliana TaxID=3702 RepID=Q94AG7_ARATH|nr:uncharacterized protein AT1G17744 [Arabidopsis thaliana]AAK76725.1 unknown protein [Arabidopsis thaliana]AAM91738.1 unknown protein [Arabidopsis thaliana]AEE29629.1 hypothetical protein AT1G17744 [Arabidopsis thaliana]CAA0215547.1 unnamed protein product [Arabidopsis thaliana]VYS46410.1 unnamed protein product [Arabidopsis thaliana]|eukprot:NP_001117302.1 hypothetical protein AT1G17744 [Arabidopsis thaliana]
MANRERTGFNRSVGLSNVTCHRSKQSNSMFGSSHRISRWSINHQTPVLRRRLQINIVNPNSGSSDHFQPPLRRLKHFPRHFSSASHDQSVTLRHFLLQIFRRKIVRAVNVAEFPEEIHAGFSQFLGDEDPRLWKSWIVFIRVRSDG